MDPALPHRNWVPFALLGAMWVLLALVVIPTWGWTYWDFGDGNYMYIARRVREGVRLYEQILAPQPPLHTLAGAFAQGAGELLFGSALTGVRSYCLLSRMAASLFLMLLAWRYFRCPFRGLAAAAIYLVLPIGFWWSLGYQSENLENVFLIAALWLLISWERKPAAIAGVCAALACMCNMTAMPYLLVTALFLAFRMPRLVPAYFGAAAGTYIVLALAAQWWTNGHFAGNVLFNQVGTFPRADILAAQGGPIDSFWAYALDKVPREAMKVLEWEGAFIAAALIGILLRLLAASPIERADSDEWRDWLRTEFLVWMAIGMFLSICFTAKGGTVNYIFVLGEPAVALFAAEAFVRLWRTALPHTGAEWRTLSIFNTWVLLRLLPPLALTGALLWQPVRNIRLTLAEVQSELRAAQVGLLRGFIETYAAPGDTILAPPFYAFLTGTNVAGELAENYIWQIKYMNERFDGAEGEAVLKMQEVAAMLRGGEVKVVLLDLAQTGRIPEIAAAIEEFWQPAEAQPFLTRNTSLGLYVPRGERLRHDPLFD